MARPRSPRYPSVSLEEAIERVRKVFQKEQTNPAPREVIATALGYSGISGASATIIGALRQYGLLVGRGDDLRVSEDALDIIHAPPGSGEYLEALNRVAFAPPLFSEVREQFGELGPSDANLRYFLAKRGLSSRAIDVAVRAFRSTVEFACREKEGHAPMDVSAAEQPSDLEAMPRVPAAQIREFGDKGMARTVMPEMAAGPHVERTVLSPGITVELRFSREPSYQDFEALAEYSEFRKKRLRKVSVDIPAPEDESAADNEDSS